MRNRRMVLAVFLLVAVFCIGSGFAAVSDILDIMGTANVSLSSVENAFDSMIYFESATPGNTTLDTARIDAEDKDIAYFVVHSLNSKDDVATFTFVIKNESDLDAVVTPLLSNNQTAEFFDVYSDWNAQPKIIKANTVESYILTVKLLGTPTNEIQGTQISVQLTAVAGGTSDGSASN